LIQPANALKTIAEWWASDAMAILTFTPMLPVFVVPRVDRWFKFPPNHLAASQHRWPSRSEIIEMGAQFGSGVLAIWIVFGLTSAIPYQPLYLLFIPLIWVSVRHGLPGAALSVFAINVGLTLASCLRLFPLSKLKIDRSFIGDIETSSDAAAVATAVISLAKSLHLKVIAEGVQTRANSPSYASMGATRSRATTPAHRWKPKTSPPSSDPYRLNS